jgi:CubicO group peptidase (beta-lactamase class C family)
MRAQPGIDRFANNLQRKEKIPGISLGLATRRGVVLRKGFGYRDLKKRLPATAQTVYGIASVTKSFTAMAILQLQESGSLKVQDPVVKYLPEFRTPDPRSTRRITLHHFLTHTSGLPPLPSIYYTSARSLERDPPYDSRVARKVGVDPDHPPLDSYEEVLGYLRTERYRLLGAPGRYFSYSNEAFGLLGAIIERVANRSYENFLEESILRPAGMRRTTFDSGIMFRYPEVTTLYSPKWRGRRHGLVASQEWWEDTSLRASGALRTNIEDLLRYVEIFRAGGRVGRERIVGPESLHLMLRPHVAIHRGLFYGYGVAVRPDYHGTPLVFHTGGLKGVSSAFAVLPKKGVGGAVLSNSDQAPSLRVLQAGINRLVGLPMETNFDEVPRRRSRPKSLAEFGGRYCSGEGIWIRVTPLAGALRFDFEGIELTQKGERFKPNGEDEFLHRQKGRDDYARFERDEDGRVWAVFEGWRLVRRRRESELRKVRFHRMVW